jgi:hypothetical protein
MKNKTWTRKDGNENAQNVDKIKAKKLYGNNIK